MRFNDSPLAVTMLVDVVAEQRSLVNRKVGEELLRMEGFDKNVVASLDQELRRNLRVVGNLVDLVEKLGNLAVVVEIRVADVEGNLFADVEGILAVPLVVAVEIQQAVPLQDSLRPLEGSGS